MSVALSFCNYDVFALIEARRFQVDQLLFLSMNINDEGKYILLKKKAFSDILEEVT